MDLIKKYNNLSGQKVSREELINFHVQLFDELPKENKTIETIWKRIGHVLETYPDTKCFDITIVNPLVNEPGLKISKPSKPKPLIFKKTKKMVLSSKAAIENAVKDVLIKNRIKGLSLRQAYFIYKITEDTNTFKIDQNGVCTEVFTIEDYQAKQAFKNKTNFYVYEDIGVASVLYLNKKACSLIVEITENLIKPKSSTKNQGLKTGVQVLEYPTLFLDISPVAEESEKAIIQNSNIEPSFVIDNSTKPTVKVEQQNEIVEVAKSADPIIKSPKTTLIPTKYKTAAQVANEQKEPVKLFNIDGDLKTLLGSIEIKPVHSLLVTLDSEEGGGKTHTFYQWANVFASAGYPTIIWSLEEHKSSGLSKSKCRKYFSSEAFNSIVVESENDGENPEDTFTRLIDSIKDFEAIFIDSLPKLVELNHRLSVDLELRKAFNGKIIFLILQRLSDGKPRGGSKASFDGDIILKGNVDRLDFRNNFIINHKNRYNDYTPLSELKYSPYHQKVISTTSEIKPKKAPEIEDEENNIIYSTF